MEWEDEKKIQIFQTQNERQYISSAFYKIQIQNLIESRLSGSLVHSYSVASPTKKPNKIKENKTYFQKKRTEKKKAEDFSLGS